jgi:hypothetical protein
MKQELLYARVNLINVPDGKKVELSGNKLMYKEQKKEVTLHQLDIPMDVNFKFMNLRVSSEPTQKDWFQIILDVDTTKFEQIFKKPYIIPNRKAFYSSIRHCYVQQAYEFLCQSTANMIKELGQSPTVKFNQWLCSREIGIQYNHMDKDVIKIGEYYIDTKRGSFSESKIETVTIAGGIIIDSSNQLWISKLVDTIDEKGNKTLIICSQNMQQLWNQVINHRYQQSPIIITSKRDLSNITYQILNDSKFVIVNSSFITHKSYCNIWDDYNLDGTLKLKEIYSIMTNELEKNPRFMEQKSPILSLIKWNRLILDCDAAKRITTDKLFEEIILTISAKTRYVHIKHLSNIRSDIITYLRYLVGDSNINFPLYNFEGKIKPFSNMVWKFDSTKQIERVVEEAQSQIFESAVDRFFLNHNSYNPLKVETVINKIILNSQSASDVSSIIKKNELVITDPCPICQEDYNITNAIFTKCAHSYCTHCAVKSCYLQGKCAMCRSPLKFDELYRVKEDTEIVGSRLSKLVDIINTDSNQKVIVIQDKDMVDHVLSLLNKLNKTCAACIGGNREKEKAVDDFNSGRLEIILIRSSDIDWIKRMISANSTIFLDHVLDMNSLMLLHFEDKMVYHLIQRYSDC